MIRRILLASVSVVGLTAAASAADMYVPGPAAGPGGYKDAPWAPTWAGFYAGVNGGYGWDADVHNIEISTSPLVLGGYPATTKGTDAEGGFGGGQIGYNWQGVWHPHLVIGVEADIEGSGIEDSFNNRVINGFGDALSAKKSLDWFSTIRARLGYSFGNVLVYGTGGFAFGGVKNQLIDVLTIPPTGTVTLQKDATATGYVVGGGVEYMISPRWSLKAEYQFIDLGSYKLSSPEVPPSGFAFSTNKIDNTFNTVRVGVNYHFGPSYEPLK
ncbi:MAG: outer membrane beta-barrel protein [Rhodomicrobium sp.]